MNRSGSLQKIVVATLIVAFLCTLIVHYGWLVWIPIIASLAVVGAISAKFGR